MTNQLQAILINKLTNGWVVKDSKDNSTATATKAAAAGKTYIITGVAAGYSSAKLGTLEIKDDSTTIFETSVNNAIDMNLNIRITTGKAVSAVLSASGTAGVIGKVNLIGFTI
jgi:hypothetical protein